MNAWPRRGGLGPCGCNNLDNWNWIQEGISKNRVELGQNAAGFRGHGSSSRVRFKILLLPNSVTSRSLAFMAAQCQPISLGPHVISAKPRPTRSHCLLELPLALGTAASMPASSPISSCLFWSWHTPLLETQLDPKLVHLGTSSSILAHLLMRLRTMDLSPTTPWVLRPVRLNYFSCIFQQMNSIFLSQQISISISEQGVYM
jgi:hypothetical protein